MRRASSLLFVLAVAACDTTEERPASFSFVHRAILEPNCATASCHSRASSVAGVDLSTREYAYAMLTGSTCDAPDPPGEPPGNFVFPYDPARSQLLYMLRAEEQTLMPPTQPLAEVEIELIERWILAGAACD